ISDGKTDVQGPNWSIIKYEFPQLGNRPPVTVFWYDGKMLPSVTMTGGKAPPGDHNGCVFVGEKGNMGAAYLQDPFFFDEELQKDHKPPAITIPRSIGHHK